MAGLLIAGCLASCSGDTPADGLGDSVVALYAASPYAMADDLHGRIILVEEDGSVRTVEHEGLYLGSVSHDGDSVFAADEKNEIVVEADSVRRLNRRGEYDMQWWAGMVGERRWTVFNVGTGASDSYESGISATDGETVAEGAIEGEPMGTVACNGQLLMATGTWKRPHDPRGSALRWLDVRGTKITELRQTGIRLPAGSHIVNVGCSSNEPVVIARDGNNGYLVAHGDETQKADSWTKLPNRQGTPAISGDSKLLGSIGNEMYFFAPDQGVRALDLDSHTVRQVVTLTSDQRNSSIGIQGKHLVGWIEDSSGSAIRWYDPSSGRVEREVDAAEVDEVLDRHDEVVEAPPVSLFPEDG